MHWDDGLALPHRPGCARITSVNVFQTPLGPALILSLGALAFLLLPLQVPPWLRRLLATFAAILAMLLVWRLWPRIGEPSVGWLWQPPIASGRQIGWAVDGWSWLASMLLLIGTTVALLLEEAEGYHRRAVYSATLFLAAACLGFVFAANLLTLLFMWFLTDLALALRTQPVSRPGAFVRAWGISSFGVWLLLAALVAVSPFTSQPIPLVGPLPPLSRTLLTLAAFLRIGIYPLHLWRDPAAADEPGPFIALFLLVPTTGLWLLGRVVGLGGWSPIGLWPTLGVLALLGSALAAWAEGNEDRSRGWILVNRASLVLLVVAFHPSPAQVGIAWTLVNLALGGAALVVGHAAGEGWGWRFPIVVGAAALWGLPLTTGFPMRLALAGLTPPQGTWYLWLVLLLAETLLAAALWRTLAVRQRVSRTLHSATLARLLFAALLTAPAILALGIMPPLLGRIISLPSVSTDLSPLLTVLRETTLPLWINLTVPLLLGLLLAVERDAIFAELRGWQTAIIATAGLEWLYRGVRRSGAWLAAGLRGGSALFEGEGYFGWLVVIGLVIWTLLSQL